MSFSYHYLIIGNGAAGLSAAEIIRRRDPTGRITIVTNEPYLFYSRPGIAYYILGQVSERQLISRSSSFYRDHNFDLRFGNVTTLDLEAQLVYFEDGEPLAYDVLLLATGASAVPPPFPGGQLRGVLTFDTLEDAKRVIKLGRKAKAAVVVGGGVTAMELAEGLNAQGRGFICCSAASASGPASLTGANRPSSSGRSATKVLWSTTVKKWPKSWVNGERSPAFACKAAGSSSARWLAWPLACGRTCNW
jgi:thioredoxin reductase